MPIYDTLVDFMGLPASPFFDVIAGVAVMIVFLIIVYSVLDCFLMILRFVLGFTGR